jgi:hypothetical protein
MNVKAALSQSCVEPKIHLRIGGFESGNGLGIGEKQEETIVPVFLCRMPANFRLLILFGGGEKYYHCCMMFITFQNLPHHAGLNGSDCLCQLLAPDVMEMKSKFEH